MQTYFCSGCAKLIDNDEHLEVETSCKSKSCAHVDPEQCARGIIYSHSNEICFEMVSQLAKGK